MFLQEILASPKATLGRTFLIAFLVSNTYTALAAPR